MRNRAIRATTTGWLTLAVAIAVSAPSAEAQIYGSGDPLAGTVDEAATIDLDVIGRPLEDVLKMIRDKSGANILLAPNTTGRVTLTFRGVPWREALELVAENAGCIVQESRGRVFKVEKPVNVTYSFDDADIRQVITAIAQAGGANVVIAPDVQGVVSLELKERPWRDALDNVVKTLGYHLVEEERGILRIVSSASLIEQLETKVIELRYLRPKAQYVATIKTDFAVGKPKEPANDPNKDFPLLDALRKHLSKNGQLDYFDRQNAIFVKDTKPVLDRITSVVERLDIEPAQIFIDVKFVTTAEGDNLDLAFGAEQVTATFNGAAISSKVPFNLGEGGFDDDIFPIDDGDLLEGPLVEHADSTALLTGLLDFRNVRLAVRLNQDVNQAEVVQAPKLITLDHQEATVFVGDIIRYAESEAATNQAGGLQFTLKEAKNSPVETGFQLLIIPHVVPGTNKVLMTVIPQARFLSGTTDPQLQGFNQFGESGVATISLPQITSQTVVTNMMLESGQTGVIGGLITDRRTKLIHKVPVLGDIPVLGFFFRRTQENETHNHLLVFLTPTIIRGAVQGEENINRLMLDDSTRIDAEWRSMTGLPAIVFDREIEAAEEAAEAAAEAAAEGSDSATDG
jgi:type IV pilus assembly protein PilQ